jgi:hypothetical protein
VGAVDRGRAARLILGNDCLSVEVIWGTGALLYRSKVTDRAKGTCATTLQRRKQAIAAQPVYRR